MACTVLTNDMTQPMASEKLNKKAIKAMKKGFKCFALRRGVKEVNKAIRNNLEGIVFIAANTTPLDVISHLPGLCEEKEIPFVFLKDRHQLQTVAQSDQAVCAVMLTKKGRKSVDEKYMSDYTEQLGEVYALLE